MTQKPASLFDWNIVGPAIADAFKKLNPRLMAKNPVMFVTMVGAALTTVGIFTAESTLRGFVAQLAIWLWFTVLFANFAEAVAEGRGKAQAASLRRARKDTMARRLQNGREVKVPAPILQKGNLVVCADLPGIPREQDEDQPQHDRSATPRLTRAPRLTEQVLPVYPEIAALNAAGSSEMVSSSALRFFNSSIRL